MMTINAEQVMRDLQIIVNRVADMTPVLRTIGDHQREAVEDRIMTGKRAPDGNPWAPWRPWRAAERAAKGNAAQGLLWDTGDLLHSLITDVEIDRVSIGTEVGYARELQFGRHDMEPRPFMGWGPSDVAEADRLAMTYIMTGAVP